MANIVHHGGAARRRLRCSTALATGAALLAASLATAVYAQDDEDDDTEVIKVTGSRLTNEFASDSPIDVVLSSEATLQGISDVASLLRTQTVALGSPQVTAATSAAFVQSGGVGTETLSLRGLGANRTLTLLNGRRAGPAGTRGAVSAFDLNVIPLSAVERIEILKDGASSIYGSDAVAGVVNLITKEGGGGDFNLFVSQPEESGGEEYAANGSYGFDLDKGWIRFTGSYYKHNTLVNGQRDYFACGQDYVFNEDGSRADFIDPRTGEPACDDLAWGHVWLYDYLAPGAYPHQPWDARPALLQYDYDGDLGNYLPPNTGPIGGGLLAPPGWYPVGYGELLLDGAPDYPYYGPYAATSEAVLNADHPFQNQMSLIPEIERTTGYINGEYDLTDHVTLYGEALLNRRKTVVDGYRQFWTYQYAYHYNYAYGYDYEYIYAVDGGDPFAFSRGFIDTSDTSTPFLFNLVGLSPTPVTNHSDTRVTVNYERFVGGLKGDLGERAPSWSWDVYGQFSRSSGKYDEDIIYDDAITPYNYRVDYCANTADAMTPVRGVPCLDIDWYNPDFLNGDLTDEERAFLFGSAVGKTVYEQWNIDGSMSGDLFEMPAGTASAALGFQYREDKIDDQPSDTILDGNAWGQSTAGVTTGEQSTQAIFGEIGIPLLSDLPFADRLDLTASARYTEIDSQGPVQGVDAHVTDESTTYKLGLGWQVVPSFKVRSTYGTSFRSPALFELFLGNETGFLGQRVIDPCVNWGGNLTNGAISQRVADNCAADGIGPSDLTGGGASATIYSRGGALTDLKSETSDATTLGLVWTPGFADLNVSVDYFDISIEDEVAQLNAANILLGCYSSLNFDTEPLCDLFHRNPQDGSEGPAGLIATVQDDYVNIATQTNRGIDFAVVYNVDTPLGQLRVNSQTSYQLKDVQQLLPTSDPYDYDGEAGDPSIVGNLDFTLDRGAWSFFYGLEYVGRTSNVSHYGDQAQTYYGAPAYYKLRTEPTIYHAASLAYELPKGLQLRVGVANIFDEHPPAVTAASGEFDTVGLSAFYSQYDWLGRRAFVNLSGSF